MPHFKVDRSFSYRTILLSLVGFTVLLATANPVFSSSKYSVGPSFSYVSGGDSLRGNAVGLDFSYINGRDPWWFSGGVRLVDASDAYAVAYGELGLAYLGVGYSHSFGGESIPRQYLHAFLGVPIPIYGMGSHGKPGFYIEPYYRPMFPLSGSDRTTAHEIGILIKFTTLKVWAPPPPGTTRNGSQPAGLERLQGQP